MRPGVLTIAPSDIYDIYTTVLAPIINDGFDADLSFYDSREALSYLLLPCIGAPIGRCRDPNEPQQYGAANT